MVRRLVFFGFSLKIAGADGKNPSAPLLYCRRGARKLARAADF